MQEEGIVHLLVHSPNTCSSQGWTRQEPAARYSTHVYHIGGRNPYPGHSKVQCKFAVGRTGARHSDGNMDFLSSGVTLLQSVLLVFLVLSSLSSIECFVWVPPCAQKAKCCPVSWGLAPSPNLPPSFRLHLVMSGSH